MVDEAGAIWAPNDNYFFNRNGYKPAYIILHGTAGGISAPAIASYFASTQGTNNPTSSHYVIDQDGLIVQCVSETDGAWANGFISQGHDPWWDPNINPNYITISIEHVKSATDNSDSLTAPQQAASFTLIQHICQRWNIPMRAADAAGGITGHFSIDPVNRSHCPGPYPADALWAFLKGGNMNIPQGWSDDGTTLFAKNGTPIAYGFRNWILQNGNTQLGEPLEAEHGANPVEEYFSQIPPDGTRQLFNFGELAYTKARGVYLVGIGNELRGARAQIASLQQQLQAAQQSAPQAAQMTVVLKQIASLVDPYK